MTHTKALEAAQTDSQFSADIEARIRFYAGTPSPNYFIREWRHWARQTREVAREYMKLREQLAEAQAELASIKSMPTTAAAMIVADSAKLRAQLTESDAQLAAERAMADLLAGTLEFVGAHTQVDASQKYDRLEKYYAHKATRQPNKESE